MFLPHYAPYSGVDAKNGVAFLLPLCIRALGLVSSGAVSSSYKVNGAAGACTVFDTHAYTAMLV